MNVLAEWIHWLALAFMVVVYMLRVRWLLRFRATRDRSAPGECGRQRSAGRVMLRSLGIVAMPWAMESTRRHLPFYFSFALFHLGIAAGIVLAFGTSLAPSLVAWPPFGFVSFGFLLVAAFLGVVRSVRRFAVPSVRLISSPDDLFSVMLLSIWLLLGAATQARLLGWLGGEAWLTGYYLLTAFFLVYVPFSKISHYLYYPFTRWYRGRVMSHRGHPSACGR